MWKCWINFLLFKNCPTLPQPTHGSLEDEALFLPSTHQTNGTLECGILYQQTEILRNPLKNPTNDSVGDLNAFNIKFVIGEEICGSLGPERKFCNGPLEPHKRFGMIARFFSENGFRDSKPVFIEVNHHSAFLSVSPAWIAIGTVVLVVVLSLLSLLALLCCFKKDKKNQKRVEKLKETAEADENLLSFTSYCVFDKNPVPRKI